MHRFAANKGALLGLVILCLVILTALLCSVWYEESPWSMVAEPLLKPLSNADYPLGTDMLGRDLGALGFNDIPYSGSWGLSLTRPRYNIRLNVSFRAAQRLGADPQGRDRSGAPGLHARTDTQRCLRDFG